MARIYLDHAATTPLLPQARDAMAEALRNWANPSSPHTEGRAARAMLEDARARVKAALGWSGELIFTSGASEALAIALLRAKADDVKASAVEHDAVRRIVGDGRLPVGADGLVQPLVDGGRMLFAIQHANNETGVLQDCGRIARRVKELGGLWLADCAQTAGKIALPEEADFIAVSAHKLGGPPGVGALLVRDLATLDAPGGQEKGYRPGTENLPGAMAFAAALEARREWLGRAAELRDHLEKALAAAGGVVVAGNGQRIPTIGAYRMPGVPAAAQLIRFDLAGIAVSAGSACSSGSVKPSHVLMAMGWPEDEAREVIRVSFGSSTTRAEIYEFIRVWTAMAADAGQRAA
ncbi:cysteine desulfurase [Sphingomonas laterariae]|uniref:Cysteine desulfurase n=1 Tax=Edaphosphingomonas laterariae TaxID=861865 RepID=A0A239JFS5_9SPHN|nr:cysteine desulfurase [Sphingomonas laterariae]